MKYILVVCVCSFVACFSFLLIALAIEMLDGTDFMDAIVERIKGQREE